MVIFFSFKKVLNLGNAAALADRLTSTRKTKPLEENLETANDRKQEAKKKEKWQPAALRRILRRLTS